MPGKNFWLLQVFQKHKQEQKNSSTTGGKCNKNLRMLKQTAITANERTTERQQQRKIVDVIVVGGKWLDLALRSS